MVYTRTLNFFVSDVKRCTLIIITAQFMKIAEISRECIVLSLYTVFANLCFVFAFKVNLANNYVFILKILFMYLVLVCIKFNMIICL